MKRAAVISRDDVLRPGTERLRAAVQALSSRALRARFVALSPPQRTMVVLITALLAIVLTTYRRYGFTVDEFKGFYRAKGVFAVLVSGRSTQPSDIDMFHGTAPDVIAMALQKIIPQLSYESRHLVFALFGVAGIYYVYRLGSEFVDEWTGVFAALFLAITPMWFGYMFINHKDIPFATLLLAANYYSLLALTGLPMSRGFWLKTGLAIGLLAATKFVGLLLLLSVVTVYLACLVAFPAQRPGALPRGLARRVALLGMVGVVGCVLGFLLFWPQFYFGQIVQAGGVSTQFADIAKWRVSKYDPSYGIMYFAISTPLFLLALAAGGVGAALYRRTGGVLAAACIFCLVFLGAAIGDARLYNGCRHFLFVYPFFMIVAAYPVSLLFEATKGKVARIALAGAIVVCMGATILEMYRLFPYQYSFYNSLVGGIAGADGVYELDTWRSAHREALNQLAAKIAPGQTVRVYSCGSKFDYRYHPNFKLATKAEADYFVAQRRGKKCIPSEFTGLPVVAEVRREGVLLARVYAARP